MLILGAVVVVVVVQLLRYDTHVVWWSNANGTDSKNSCVCVGFSRDPEQPKAESLVIACLRLVHAVHGQTSAVRSSAQRWAMQRMVSTLRRVPNANRQRNMTMMQPTMKSSDIIGVWCCTPRLERMAACASAANAPATPLSASAHEVARRVAIAAVAIPSRPLASHGPP